MQEKAAIFNKIRVEKEAFSWHSIEILISIFTVLHVPKKIEDTSCFNFVKDFQKFQSELILGPSQRTKILFSKCGPCVDIVDLKKDMFSKVRCYRQ